MKPRIVHKSVFTIAGVTATGMPGQLNYSEIWDKGYMPFDPALKTLRLEDGYFGATFNEHGTYVYLAGVAIREGVPLPPGVETRRVPAARYAVFDCALDQIGATWKEAYENWLPTSVFVLDNIGSDFEFYPPVGSDGAQVVQIHIPVREKGALDAEGTGREPNRTEST